MVLLVATSTIIVVMWAYAGCRPVNILFEVGELLELRVTTAFARQGAHQVRRYAGRVPNVVFVADR